ncbi:MAG TPA: crosslink repair DNA glycosylase YcaQ family protein, partial [Gaiellaceae bacterium]|nr:crosslink repair DNA glycosylase YcaQ family protein [Gaiellaceae bacterium]
RRELHKELVDAGAIVPVAVEGMRGKRFVLAEELALLQAPPEPKHSVAFIAPFDSLLWDTALLASLFDFEFVWEGFFPPAKRRWGYYVLPIVFRDRFVGRIEPRIDRDRGRVEVLDVWWEDGFAPRRADGFVDAMRDAFREYLRFAGAERLEWATHLAAERRLFPAVP